MRRLVIVLILAALASPALAGQNPDIAIFLNTAQDGSGDNQVSPVPNATFDVYVCFDRFGPFGGISGAEVRFVRTFEGYMLDQQLLVGWGLGFGDIEVDGYQFVGGPELCVYPDDSGVVGLLRVEYLYLGGPGTITVLGSNYSGNATWDCNPDPVMDPWCVASIASHGFSGHFGVCMPPPETRAPDCQPIVTPVEDGSWGTIKSLYR